MDTRTRAWLYRAGFLLIAALIVIDVVMRGGDAAGWVDWLVRAAGISAAGLAAKNTATKADG